MTLPIRPLPSCSCSLPCVICTYPSRPSGKRTKTNSALRRPSHGPPEGHCAPADHPRALVARHGVGRTQEPMCRLEDYAMPSGNQRGLALSPSRLNPIARGGLACDVGQNIVTIPTPPSPFLASPKQATSVVFFTLLPYTRTYTPIGLFRSSAFGTLRPGVFQITVAGCAHRQVRAPHDGPCQPVTPHVFARRRPSFPGSHALLSPPWPSSNLADRIDRLPSTPCRDCPSPLSVPNPANCGCR